MRFSNSELLSLLQRAFEGAGWIDGRNEDAATSVWWLQSHGIHWLDQLPEFWSRLNPELESKPKLIKKDAASSILDAGDASLLHCGSNSVDLLYANACQETLATLETRRCLDRVLILPGLSTLARRGANALARWHSKGRLHVATISAGQKHPTHTEYGAPAPGNSGSNSLYLACSRQHKGLDHFLRSKTRLDRGCPVLRRRTPDHFERDAKLSLTNGIEVGSDSIDILNQSAERLLVATDGPTKQDS